MNDGTHLMHLCLVTPYPIADDAVVGGVEAASLRLVRALLDRGGVRVTVVAPTESDDRVECRGPVEIRWVNSGPSSIPGIVRYWTLERRNLLAAVRDVGADVVHVQAIAGWGLGLKQPRIFQMHGVPEEAVLHNQRRSRKLSAAVHRVVEGKARGTFPVVAVVGAHMAERFASQFTGKVVVAENTVPDAYFSIERTPVPGRVLFGGIVSNRKNTLTVLKALAPLAPTIPNLTFHVAGDLTSFPDYVEECRRFVSANGLEGNVDFMGSISIDKMRSELREAQVVVLPSYNESAPIIISEAMAARVPVISSRRDGMVNMVAEAATGYLIEPDDVEGLTRHLRTLLTDDALNVAMGERARDIAVERFSGTVLAATAVSAYEQALGRTSLSSPDRESASWRHASRTPAVVLSKGIQTVFERCLYRFGIRGATTVSKRVCHFLPNDQAEMINGLGARFRFPAWDSYYGHYLYRGVTYEPEIVQLLATLGTAPTGCLLDCGANYGYWSVVAAPILRGQIVAVELNPATTKVLQANAELNDRRFAVVNAAVWHRDGDVMGVAGSGPNQGDHAELLSGGSGIQSRSIDSLRLEFALDAGALLVKVDCEGAELDALRGASETAGQGAAFVLEDHGNDPNCAVSAFLLDEGWTLAIHDGSRWSKVHDIAAVRAMKTDPERGYNVLAWRGLEPTWLKGIVG